MFTKISIYNGWKKHHGQEKGSSSSKARMQIVKKIVNNVAKKELRMKENEEKLSIANLKESGKANLPFF